MALLLKKKVLLCIVIVQLTITARCLLGEGIFDESFPAESSPATEGSIDIDGFRVDPDLLLESLDDSLRSKEEQKLETSSTEHPFKHICPNGYFVCNNGECIAPKWRCDGHYDCDDFSDELNCTTLDLPQHGSIAPPTSTIYTAPPRPNTTQVSALSTQVYGLDFNSTVEPLMIFSTGTSIRGLWMQARVYFDIVIRSKPRSVSNSQPSITDAFSLFFGIFGGDPSAQSQSSSAKSSSSSSSSSMSSADDAPGKPDSTIVGLDMDPSNKEVFWVELGKEPGVYSAIVDDEQFEARNKRQHHGYRKIVEHGLLSPEDIALDTVGKNAYITDGGLPAVVVCSYVNVHCKIIVHEKIHKPRAIIADSSTGWITFTDWGDRPGIYLVSMDGRRFETLIQTDVVWPNGLAADPSTNQLYWADARLNKIERVDLITRKRSVIITELNTNPFSVSLFENRIYWSDWARNEIKTCNKMSGNDTQVVMHADDIYGIHIYHPDLHSNEPANPCWSKHCSHLCLLSPSSSTYAASRKRTGTIGATCACPDTMFLSSLDKSTCYESESTFLLVNVRNYVAQVFPERIGLRIIEEVVYSREHAIQDMASDWHNHQLFFFDASRQIIFLVDFAAHVPGFQNLTTTASKSIRGLLFDAMSDNLYWLDPENGSLIMFSTRGKFQKVLRHNMDRPTSMVLDSKNRVFYIASLGVRPRIVRTDVTGSEQSDVVLVDSKSVEGGGLGLPVALYLDESLQRLYFADARSETIESLDLDIKSRTTGTRLKSRQVYRRRLGTILSFAIYHDSFMWTVQNEGFLYKAKIIAPKNSRPVAYKLPPNPNRDHLSSDYKRLIAVDPLYDQGAGSPCHATSCSHGCILDSTHSAKCVCPDGLKLSILNRTNCIENAREEECKTCTPQTLVLSNKQAALLSAGGTPSSSSNALNNIISHLDGLGDNVIGVDLNGKSSPTTVRNSAKMGMVIEQLHNQRHDQHDQQHQQVEAAAAAVMAEPAADDVSRESNRMVWLIVFLLILSATGIVTVISLLMLHRQGRLPRSVSVSFISPSGGTSQDKDRAMLLLDTDS